jgi:hypothetical protein
MHALTSTTQTIAKNAEYWKRNETLNKQIPLNSASLSYIFIIQHEENMKTFANIHTLMKNATAGISS